MKTTASTWIIAAGVFCAFLLAMDPHQGDTSTGITNTPAQIEIMVNAPTNCEP